MLNTLNVALSGLAASKTNVENVMNNIANENTVGYKKRVVDIKEADQSDSRLTGRGAELLDVNRITNIYMYDNLMDEVSRDAELTELSMMLADVESLFYETEDSGFSADLDKFFQSIEDMRANPYNEINRTNMINQGNILVDDLKSLYTEIEDREYITEQFLTDNVSAANALLQDIGKINIEIQNAIVPSNDLLDKRDQLEYELSQYFDIKVDRADTYALYIGDIAAVRYNTNVHEIQIVEDNIAQKDVYETTTGDNMLNIAPLGAGDSVTYTLNKDMEVTVEIGETVDGQVVTKDNIVQALTYKINNSDMASFVTAYNGAYSYDENGNQILQEPTNQDHFLMIESITEGVSGQFDGKIIINDDANVDTSGDQVAYFVDKNEVRSVDAQDDIHLEVFDEEITLTSGKLKPIVDNLQSDNVDNMYDQYKSMLDNFANKLADVTESYIFLGDREYVYGNEASIVHPEDDKTNSIGLFEGSSVMTLQFNDVVVRNLSQEDLDYLATIHWNEEMSFDDSGTTTSFSKYFQQIRVQVSSDKENVDYLKETQTAVKESLQLTYDKVVKVDKDEEMVNLIKFQAAYEANAKMITVVDEMLQTILGLKS